MQNTKYFFNNFMNADKVAFSDNMLSRRLTHPIGRCCEQLQNMNLKCNKSGKQTVSGKKNVGGIIHRDDIAVCVIYACILFCQLPFYKNTNNNQQLINPNLFLFTIPHFSKYDSLRMDTANGALHIEHSVRTQPKTLINW